MIVETISIEEIHLEIKQDLESVFTRAQYFMQALR